MTAMAQDTGYTLTAQDVRAMRHADNLCFDHLRDGTGQIRAFRSADSSASGFEEMHLVRATLSTVRQFGQDVGPVQAYVYMGHSNHDECMVTLTRAMRAGSRIALEWTRHNQSPVLDSANMVRDELRVRVESPDGKTVNTFLVAVQVGLDNSARMVRPIGGIR